MRTVPVVSGAPPVVAVISASRMRCTQEVHFSITPRARTVTSGLRARRVTGAAPALKSYQLKRRTLYGQLFEQKRVPTQRL